MMSMEMRDSTDLLPSSRGSGLKNYWRSRTVMEQAMLVLAVVEAVMILGFVIGVACLSSEISAKDEKINRLTIELEECEAGTTTGTPGNPTTTSSMEHSHREEGRIAGLLFLPDFQGLNSSTYGSYLFATA